MFPQDGNNSIENEELHGFLKDLMELVQEVGIVRTCTERGAGDLHAHLTYTLLLQRGRRSSTRLRYLRLSDRCVGLVVKAPASRAEDPGFKSCLRRDFSGSSHTSELKIGTPVATLSGAWRYRVSAGTGRPGASTL